MCGSTIPRTALPFSRNGVPPLQKGNHHHPPAGHDGYRLKRHEPCWFAEAANELGFTTAAVRVDRENFLSDFSLPCIAQVITDEGLAHFVTVFKKTTLKDDGERRKHAGRSRAGQGKPGKKHKCKDYVVIGDPAKELKKISLDEFYKNFTGVLLLLTPTAEFNVSQRKKLAPGAPGYEAQQASEKSDGKPNRWGMMKRYIDLLLPQKSCSSTPF